LDGIELDTSKIKKLFQSWGFEVQTLYDSQAMKIVDYLEAYTKRLSSNDYFAFYYSGHGSFVPDKNGDEEDGKDETLVLSDGIKNKHLIDDILYDEFNRIKAKKIIILDSCHSGTAFRGMNSRVKAKSISPNDVTESFSAPAKMRGVSVSSSKDIIEGSDYVVFSASQDNEESLATPSGSLFTRAIYKTFSDPKYLNEPLKDIKSVLTKDVLEYARETQSTPHHPNISVSDLSIENRSLGGFIQSKSAPATKIQRTANRVSSTSLEATLNGMLKSDKFERFSITYDKTSYKSGESVKFTIDTNGKRGFLTIFHIDGNDITLLYPNGFISPTEIEGSYKFPKDLADGKFELEAYRSCKGCSEERTTIFALLSSTPITDVSKIKSKELISFSKTSQESQALTRAVRVKVKSQGNFKPLLGKYEFIVN
jgi:hypothetical protein